MAFVQNVPFFSIILSMFSGIVSSVLPEKQAKWLNTAVITLVGAMSAWLLSYLLEVGGSCTLMALIFSIIMLLSLLGGRKKLKDEVEITKHNIYYILTDLLLSSLLALIYTNDLFTAYVFVEINTISACGLIMIRQNGRTIEAAVRYMIMSLLGSGLLLMGICMLYDLTGHLLMLITIGLITVGLSIKSALFPFHAWLPDAYGYSTVSSAAMLSSLVSKGYIFLLIKIFYRVIGIDIIRNSNILNVLFVFGLCAMIFGSVSAIWENDIRRMISFSSVAQIGYIYMGFGLGTEAGMVASVFHILMHAATKSMLFISAIGLTDVSNGSRHFAELTGSGYRNKIAGIGFTVGSLSMVGIPCFAGFVSKILFAQAAVANNAPVKIFPTVIVLAVSTILNAVYFLKTVIRIYVPEDPAFEKHQGYLFFHISRQKLYGLTIICFIALNLVLGMMSQPIVHIIEIGLQNFS